MYLSLTTEAAQEGFYGYHRDNCGWKASDRCIYSPDVVTCAAPHLHRNTVLNAEDMLALHIKRAGNILRVCACNDVDIFVGGAFGCGAFHNDPCITAWAWREALKEYREKFELIDFVIYISDFPEKRPSGETNFYAFRNEFAE